MSHNDVDALLSALRLQGPGPGFAARTVAAFEATQGSRRIKQMVVMLSSAALLSGVSVSGAYLAGWLNAAEMLIDASVVLAQAAIALRYLHHAVIAAPIVGAALIVVMAMASVATTVALERSLRWSTK